MVDTIKDRKSCLPPYLNPDTPKSLLDKLLHHSPLAPMTSNAASVPQRQSVVPFFRVTASAVSQQDGQLQAPTPKPAYVPLTVRYEFVKSAGQSSEGIVDIMRSFETKQLVVLKTIRWQNASYPPTEALMLRLVGEHRNILRMFEAEFHPAFDMAVICNEYCAGNDLAGLLYHWATRSMVSPAMVVLHVMTQIGEALAFMHGGWVHRTKAGSYKVTHSKHVNMVLSDMKPDNIFIRSHRASGNSQLPDFVIGDFGQAFRPSQITRYGGGTPGYRAPEQDTSNAPITAKSDVYAYGVTMLSLCEGLRASLYSSGKASVRVRMPRHLRGLGIVDLLTECLQANPNDRPSMSPQGVLGDIADLRARLQGMQESHFLPAGCWPASITN